MPYGPKTPEEFYGTQNIFPKGQEIIHKVLSRFDELNDGEEDFRPEFITIVSWMALHECHHMGCEETLEKISEGADFEYNPFASNNTNMLYAFADEDKARHIMGLIEGLCGGSHYRLVNGRYEEFNPKIIGGVNVNDKRQVREALQNMVERNRPLVQAIKNQNLEDKLQKGFRLN